jgi:predicted transcriptional regulator
VKPQVPNNEKDFKPADTGRCSVCKDLLANLGQFFDMLETARRSNTPEWLTVDDIAQELKISKSIVYRLIRNGELEAVDLVVSEVDGLPQKGHYRIKRSALDRYLEAKKVKRPLDQPPRQAPSQRFPKVKNHLQL